MVYNFQIFDQKTEDVISWLKQEYSLIRTGRATPVILDAVSVESYGSKMSIRELAGISVEDPKTLRITPWDITQSKNIEKGIIDSGLGLSVSTDEKGLRVSFPQLTTERRVALVKVAKQKQEEAKISLRLEREKIKSDIDLKEKKGEISEDDKFRYYEELQKRVEIVNKKIDEMAEKKEQEIIT